jgi:hypothetical protein
VPAKQRRGKVGSREEVETAGKGQAGDTVERAANPGDLGLIDGKVGSDRAVQALLGEVLGRIRGVCRRNSVPASVSNWKLWTKAGWSCNGVGLVGHDVVQEQVIRRRPLRTTNITDLFWTFLPRATAAGEAVFINDHRIA